MTSGNDHNNQSRVSIRATNTCLCLVSGTPRACQWRHEQQLSEDRPLTSDILLPSPFIDALFREIEAHTGYGNKADPAEHLEIEDTTFV